MILFHNYYCMSRKNEIKNKDIIESKPYLTKKELGLLLEKKGKNLDKKISLLLRDKYLIPLKRGLYVAYNFYLKNRQNLEEYLANILYYPSYLTAEYVLAKEGIIPENVYTYTSVSLKATRSFKNQFGNFYYRKIKENLFCGFYQKTYLESYQIKIASLSKALFDYLYFMPFSMAKNVKDLRLNLINFKKEDYEEFFSYVKISQSEKMKKIYQLIKKEYDY